MREDNEQRQKQIRELLAALNAGDDGALEQLVSEIYPELKQLARFQLAGERHGHTLNTTAVVHEAFSRLAGRSGGYADRAHFMRTAATIMRHLLIDYARRRRADKRGAGAIHLTITDDGHGGDDDTLAVLALDAAMASIKDIDEKLEQVVECRCFAGLSVAETAEALEMSTRSVERYWQRARAYLVTAMEDEVP